ncbi:MAG: hypothetical protein M3Z96_03105 [Pseudomonadota bacterium]|nr:hypothetical protein [Pseudomonadota bacterium]
MSTARLIATGTIAIITDGGRAALLGDLAVNAAPPALRPLLVDESMRGVSRCTFKDA